MKQKGSHFNALSRLPIIHLAVRESTVRSPPSPSDFLRVVTLHQQDHLRSLLVLVVPAMILARKNCAWLTHPTWLYQFKWEDILVKTRFCVAYSQRIFVDRLDGAPEVDDLESRLQ